LQAGAELRIRRPLIARSSSLLNPLMARTRDRQRKRIPLRRGRIDQTSQYLDLVRRLVEHALNFR
jgi:hypothetical protein